jgi:hypothetical protein
MEAFLNMNDKALPSFSDESKFTASKKSFFSQEPMF